MKREGARMEQVQASSNDSQPQAGVPQHLLLMLKDLERLRSFSPVTYLIMSAMMLGMVPMLVMVAVTVLILLVVGINPYLIAGAMVLCLAIVALMVIITARRMAMLRQYSSELPGRILVAGLVDKLARGFETLPDIHKYTAYPWKLLLGSPPRTTQQQWRLVAGNLEWYLLPEPRLNFHRFWNAFPLTLILIVLAIAFAVALTEIRGLLPQVPIPMQIAALSVVVVFLFGPMLYYAWQAIYTVASVNAGAVALVTAIRDRYGLQ